jgi:hypothetical protein
LPRDADPDLVKARYAKGCLAISIASARRPGRAASRSGKRPSSFEENITSTQNPLAERTSGTLSGRDDAQAQKSPAILPAVDIREDAQGTTLWADWACCVID